MKIFVNIIILTIILAGCTQVIDEIPLQQIRTGRINVDEDIQFGAGTEDVSPNATVSETGGSCDTSNAHTQMDNDPDGGTDGNECLADSDIVNHDIHFNFATPLDGDDVDTTTDAQVFAILIKHSKASGNGNPTVALDLYCNGSLVEAGADQTFDDAYTVISESFTFNAVSCATDGSDVEVFIDCTAADGGGSQNDASCSYDSIEWEATTAAAGGEEEPRPRRLEIIMIE